MGHTKWISGIIIAFVAGALGGYYYGAAQNETEQGSITAEEDAVRQISEAANPFADDAPAIESGYTNPFEAVNPFRSQ